MKKDEKYRYRVKAFRLSEWTYQELYKIKPEELSWNKFFTQLIDDHGKNKKK